MMGKVNPITPDEAKARKETDIPDEVIEAFNELLIKNHSIGTNSIAIGQDEVVALIVKKGLNRSDIFDKHWLDVEDVYRAAGWIVDYDKPGYNEDYSAYFTFKRRRKK